MAGTVFLANVYLTTTRQSHNNTTGGTSGYTLYLSKVKAHIEPNLSPSFMALPDAALTSEYTASVASGTDIALGDRISLITLLDGVTVWPGEWPAASANEFWQVAYILESTPGFLSQRLVYLKRMTGGGPAHP